LSWTPNGDGMLWVLISHKQALHFKAKTSAGAVSPLFLCGRSRTNAIRSIGRRTFEGGLSLCELPRRYGRHGATRSDGQPIRTGDERG
jgi:hypothetical protein